MKNYTIKSHLGIKLSMNKIKELITVRKPIIIVISVILICLLSGCSSSGSTSSTHSKIDCKGSIQQIKAKMDIKINDGVIMYELLNPTGAVRWEGEVNNKKRLSEERNFSPVSGTWYFNVAAHNVTGEFEIILQGTD